MVIITVDTNTVIVILGIATVIGGVFAYLVDKLLRYEGRIAKIETKLGDWDQYFRIIRDKVAEELGKKGG